MSEVILKHIDDADPGPFDGREAEQAVGPAFMTGSLVYGTPREESDVDLVVAMTPETAGWLYRHSDGAVKEKFDWKYPSRQMLTMWFGKLNVLAVFTKAMYESWAEGTAILKDREVPATREEAVELFTRLRKERGIEG